MFNPQFKSLCRIAFHQLPPEFYCFNDIHSGDILQASYKKNYETYNRSARILFSNKCFSQVIQLSWSISSYLQLFWSISGYFAISSYLRVIWVNLELSGSILVLLALFLTTSAYQWLYLPNLVSLGLSRAVSAVSGYLVLS